MKRSKKIDTPENLKLDRQLCFALYSSSHILTQVYAKVLQEFRLTYPQYLVMLVLWEHKSLSVKEIGDQLFLDSGTLTPLLKRMEQNNLIIRQRSKQDERRVDVTLSKEGLELKKKAVDIPRCIFEASGLGLSDIELLKNKIQNLRENLVKSKVKNIKSI